MPLVKGFRRLSAITVSSRQVVTEISHLVPGSNVQQCGRPSAAVTKKSVRKRVPTDERKAMLQSFVNKYREIYVGKFPTVTCAKKEVGGGYYTIRKMLQEAYYSKISSVEKGFVKENKLPTAVSNERTNESSSPVCSKKPMDREPYNDARQDPISNFDTNFGLKVGFQPSTNGEQPESSNDTRDNTHTIAKEARAIEGPHQEKPEHSVKEESPSVDNLDDSVAKVKWHEPAVKINITRDTELKEGKKKATLWGFFKSALSRFL